MILCNYTTDTGKSLNRIKPKIQGLDTINNKFISPQSVLLQISNYVPIDEYFTVDNKAGYCSTPRQIRPRLIIIQDTDFIYELEYYQPFFNLDWQTLEQLNIKMQTIGEKLNHFLLERSLN